MIEILTRCPCLVEDLISAQAPSQRLEIEGSALHDSGIMAVEPLVVTFGVSEVMHGVPCKASVLRGCVTAAGFVQAAGLLS